MNIRLRPTAGFKTILAASLTAALWLSAPAAERPLRILILSGQNNHDWRATTPKLQSILTATGRFEVSVNDHPEDSDASSFRDCDALLSNWNGFGNAPKDWPLKMREAFLQFVREGHGLVIVHAGSSSFLDWKDYQDLVGGTWGPETGHGSIHRFEVKMTAIDHPITRGFPPFQTTDELWHKTATRPTITVLATAFSATESGGSGRDEPVAFVTTFGKGRCFNLVLGHDVKAMESAGFQGLLARGTEWAGSGKVTLPAPSLEAALGISELLDAAARYEATGSRASLLAVERAVAACSTSLAARQAMAVQLAARLTSAATLDARKFFCWQLSIVGSREQVPTIAPLLADTNLAYYARLALERIPGDESFAALRNALSDKAVTDRLGIITSLGVRADARAIPDLSSFAQGSDAATASAAIEALGRMGGTEAFSALSKLEPGIPAALTPTLRRAQLHCADSLISMGKKKEAEPVLQKLSASGETPVLRAAAFQLWTSALGREAGTKVLAALKGDDAVVREAALQSLKGADLSVLTSAAQNLDNLTPQLQVSVLAILSERHATGALPYIAKMLPGTKPPVRLAAISTLGKLGEASTVQPLIALLPAADAAERSAIADALASLPGKGVEEALLAAFKNGSPEVQVAAVKALRTRASQQAIPAFTTAAANPNSEVRREAVRALGQLGDASSCAPLIALLPKASPQDLQEIQSALAEIARRTSDVAPLVDAIPQSKPEGQAALLNALAAVGGPKALDGIEAQLRSGNAETRLAALRLLVEWPDPAPLDTLGTTLLTSTEPRSRALALRGVARLAPLAKDSSRDKVVEAIGKALPAANNNEQKMLLTALGEIPSLASLKTAGACLAEPALAADARAAVYKVLDALGNAPRAEVLPILQQLKSSASGGEAARLESLDLKFGDNQKLSAGATATSLDGLKADGQGGPPSAAIDGNPDTYWDEEDNQKLYILKIDLKQLSAVAYLRIMGFQQHNFAPRDFEIFGDGKLLKKVEGARYTNNWLQVNLPGARCRSLEFRITGYYGGSPAIRELEIYGQPAER